MTIRYCTKEWLEESARLYRANPHFEEALQKVTAKVMFRIRAEPGWGIERDHIFGVAVDQGKLLDLDFYSEDEARSRADFILAASPKDWKSILRKEKKFITEFLKGKFTLEYGSKSGLLKITPYANHLVAAMTQFPLQFPDEMSEEELQAFREDLSDLPIEVSG